MLYDSLLQGSLPLGIFNGCVMRAIETQQQ